jgi:hypothetical protein
LKFGDLLIELDLSDSSELFISGSRSNGVRLTDMEFQTLVANHDLSSSESVLRLLQNETYKSS